MSQVDPWHVRAALGTECSSSQTCPTWLVPPELSRFAPECTNVCPVSIVGVTASSVLGAGLITWKGRGDLAIGGSLWICTSGSRPMAGDSRAETAREGRRVSIVSILDLGIYILRWQVGRRVQSTPIYTGHRQAACGSFDHAPDCPNNSIWPRPSMI